MNCLSRSVDGHVEGTPTNDRTQIRLLGLFHRVLTERRCRRARAACGAYHGSRCRSICLNRPVTALYRKYRPQTFAEVVGQEAVVRTLSNAIESGKIRQAYLFAGPRGTGKTSLARILAKSVNCERGPDRDPRQHLPRLRRDHERHLARRDRDGRRLPARNRRHPRDPRPGRAAPVEGRSKVYILDEAHQLTDAAWNALLKLIEEPPPHLLFIFCTTELQKVLPTVRSRCQTFVFQRPRLPDSYASCALIADAEEIDGPRCRTRADRPRRRAAPTATPSRRSTSSPRRPAGTITVQDVLQLLGAVEDEVLFRLCDLVVDGDTAGALVLPRGALRAGPGSRRGSSPTCSSTCAT